jgi:hypothetical protein
MGIEIDRSLRARALAAAENNDRRIAERERQAEEARLAELREKKQRELLFGLRDALRFEVYETDSVSENLDRIARNNRIRFEPNGLWAELEPGLFVEAAGMGNVGTRHSLRVVQRCSICELPITLEGNYDDPGHRHQRFWDLQDLGYALRYLETKYTDVHASCLHRIESNDEEGE